MPPEGHPLVFVYGTLKRGLGNHRVMVEAGGEFICRGRTLGRFPLVERGLPYLLPQAGSGHRVEGEIYRVPGARGWARIDRLEGHPGFYRRQITPVEGEDGDIYAAWTYFLVRGGEELAGLPPLCAYGREGGVLPAEAAP